MSLTAAQLSQARENLQEKDSRRGTVSRNKAIGRLEISRYWEVNNDKHQICIDYLSEYTYAGATAPTDRISNPRLQRDTYAGTFLNVSTQDTPQKNRFVYQTLRQIFTITTINTLSARPSLKTQSDQVIRPFGFQSGDADVYAFVYYDIDPQSESACLAFSPETLVEKIAGAGWTFVDRSFQIAQDGTGLFALQFRKVEWTGTYATNKKKIQVSLPGRESEAQTFHATGLPDDGIEAEFDGITATSGSTLLSKSLSEGALGERIITAREQKINQIVEDDKGNITSPSDSDALVTLIRDNFGNNLGALSRQWYRWSEEAKEYLIDNDPIGPARTTFTYQGIQYSHVTVNIADHHDGAYTVTQLMVRTEYGEVIDASYESRGAGTVEVFEGVERVKFRKFLTKEAFDINYINLRTTLLSFGGDKIVNGSLRIGQFGRLFLKGVVTRDEGWTDWEDLL